jgi:lipoprotein-anchoring transpeptidase ErfK/SrfK
VVLAFCVLAGAAKVSAPGVPVPVSAQPAVVVTTVAPGPAPSVERTLPAVAPPGDLPVISYRHVPRGFPSDPSPASLLRLGVGLHPYGKIAVYDAPGGRPTAFLPAEIEGVSVVVPVVGKRPGWSAVLLPSVNRRIGWVPNRGWHGRVLRDQVVVRLGARTLTWLRDGVPERSWRVAIGASRTPTPVGRTFVLGRTGTHGSVYAGLDALVLGAVPDDREALPPGLRDAHTGIHAWYSSAVFGRSVSNGCVRMPPEAQRTLLENLGPGTPITVLG